MSTAGGVIHDLGYQRYQGRRYGRGYAAASLYGNSLRTAYGLGRGARAKVFPWLVIGLIAAVAIVVTAVQAAAGEQVLSYHALPDAVFLLTVLFCAVAAPELVSRDLRSGVLPLYFARPLRRGDYALAKLGALVTAVWLILAGAAAVMFAGEAFAVTDFSQFWRELRDFLGGLGYALLHALVFGALALLVASLIGRRAVAAGIIVAVFLVTLPVVALLDPGGGQTPAGLAASQLAGLASPSTLVTGVRQWLFNDGAADIGGFGPLYGAVTLALVALCTSLLLLRYRRVAQ